MDEPLVPLGMDIHLHELLADRMPLYARCGRCGHTTRVAVLGLAMRASIHTRLQRLDRKLRCFACRARSGHFVIRLEDARLLKPREAKSRGR